MKMMRGKSARLDLRILNIFRPPREVKMTLPTMIVSIRTRVIDWRKSLSSIHLINHTISLTDAGIINRRMQGTSKN